MSNDESPRADTADTAPRPPIDGRSDFVAGVHEAVRQAAQNGVHELFFVDADFNDWPLDDPTLLAELSSWAGPQRRLWLIAHDFEALSRRHPRFVAWRRTWAHVMACRVAPELDRSELPCLLLAGDHSLQLLDRQRLRGRWLSDADDQRTWREVVDAVLQRSQEAFPANTLGL